MMTSGEAMSHGNHEELQVYRSRVEEEPDPDDLVLIVDDNEDDLHLLKVLLMRHDYQVVTATNGAEALERIPLHKPDLILLDLIMPYMDGIKTCRIIKANYETTATPVIIISHRESTNDIVKAFEAGADDYITKPFRPAELLARLRANLRRTSREITANPLTRIPGINFLYHQVRERLARGEDFILGICDIDNFKAYNDRYGFEAGDRVIQHLADMLRTHIVSSDPVNCLAHLGGDDFIFLCRDQKVREICEGLIKDFDEFIPSMYNEEDLKRGYIQAINRQGSIEFFPIMTISVGLAGTFGRTYSKLAELAEEANEVKQFLKKSPTSSYLVNRRR
ncbi:response regulator [bacterium]|nr:response regulator [candidate division CSSED10-310 bacterium]